MPRELRPDDTGEAVRDLQHRLQLLGHAIGEGELGRFGPATRHAVLAFQEQRGLHVDGIVGPETWSGLVEAGLVLGDRLLYFRQPALRGDDVAELQRRLNSLGFDAGREDGIFGVDTQHALLEFQQAAALPGDGICGSAAIAALGRLGSLAEGSVAVVRERAQLRDAPRDVAQRKVLVLVTPGLAALGEYLTRALRAAGAGVVLDASGDSDPRLAEAANRYSADLCLALRPGDGPRCAYFASGRFRSEAGHTFAAGIAGELAPLLGAPPEVTGKAYTILRETRMPAVVCELAPDGDVEAMRNVTGASPAIAAAIARGVRAGIERPALPD